MCMHVTQPHQSIHSCWRDVISKSSNSTYKSLAETCFHIDNFSCIFQLAFILPIHVLPILAFILPILASILPNLASILPILASMLPILTSIIANFSFHVANSNFHYCQF